MSSAVTDQKPFSLKNFLEVYNKSLAKQFLSAMEITQIDEALKEKNLLLLKPLYDILLQGQVADEKIVRDFVMTKNRLIDQFEIKGKDIVKKYVEAPRKKRVATLEKAERDQADNILNQL